MRAVPFIVVALAAGAVAGALNAARSNQPPSRLPEAVAPAVAGATADKPYGTGPAPFTHRPATSCAAAACHGGGAVGSVGSEHSTWAREAVPSATGDPHAKAYGVLFNPVSVRMGQLLGFDGKKEPLPHENTKCLACHAVVEGAKDTKDTETREQFLSEGVGCGGCHGPAEKWISEHTLPSWKARSNESKWKDFGFVPTKSLVARSLNCASCHVGDAGRDMNHDFIAAGHPRLAFEPARFHAQPDYRKHWTEKGSPRDFEVRLWVVGQAVTLRAAVNLLYDRATRAAKDDGTPWPEFSGHSCYACHQKLADTDTRGAVGATPRRPGTAGWEVWSNTAVGIAASTCSEAFPGVSSPKLSRVEDLRKLMGASRSPDPKKVAAAALDARNELDRWLAQLQAAEERGLPAVADNVPQKLTHTLAKHALAPAGKLADHDWDALASAYLGAAAMYSANGGKSGPKEWGDPLREIGASLRFPARADGGAFNSPFDLDQKKLNSIRNQFERLRSTTEAPEGK